MKLDYLKLGNNEYIFDSKIVIFMGGKNTGKTSIYKLIKFIFGMKIGPRSYVYKIKESILKKDLDYTISWKFKKDKEEYYLILKDNKIVTPNKEIITLQNYSKHILERTNYYQKIMNYEVCEVDSLSYREDFSQIQSSGKNNNRFFVPEKSSASYTSIMFLKMIGNDISYQQEKYFNNIGRLVNLQKHQRENERKLEDTDSNIIEIMEDDNLDVLQNYLTFKTTEKDNIDENILKELREIGKSIDGFDIDKIIAFHDSLTESYNQVVVSEKKRLEKENSYLRNYNKNDLKRALRHHNLKNDIKEDINMVEENLKKEEKYISSKNFIKLNADIQGFCDNFNNTLKNKNLYMNALEYKENRNLGRIDTLQINLNLKTIMTENSGGSDTNINFLGFLLYTLNKSQFPFIMLEKAFISENPNVIVPKLINGISEVLEEDKTAIITLHPDEGLSSSIRLNSEVKIFNAENNFFGLVF